LQIIATATKASLSKSLSWASLSKLGWESQESVGRARYVWRSYEFSYQCNTAQSQWSQHSHWEWIPSNQKNKHREITIKIASLTHCKRKQIRSVVHNCEMLPLKVAANCVKNLLETALTVR
jgi:sulfite reductase beta subunit-like hemoprotein